MYPKIKILRKANKLRQSEVASILNITLPTYIKLESGSRDIKGEEILNLCKLYKVSPTYILKAKNNKIENITLEEILNILKIN